MQISQEGKDKILNLMVDKMSQQNADKQIDKRLDLPVQSQTPSGQDSATDPTIKKSTTAFSTALLDYTKKRKQFLMEEQKARTKQKSKSSSSQSKTAETAETEENAISPEAETLKNSVADILCSKLPKRQGSETSGVKNKTETDDVTIISDNQTPSGILGGNADTTPQEKANVAKNKLNKTNPVEMKIAEAAAKKAPEYKTILTELWPTHMEGMLKTTKEMADKANDNVSEDWGLDREWRL